MAGERTIRRGASAGGKDTRPAGGKPKGGSPRPPLTPMIDVTFLLLLFFLLTFTFRCAEGQIPGSLPQIADGPPGLPTTVLIRPAGPDRAEAIFEIEGNIGLFTNGEQLHAALVQRARLLDEDPGPALIKASGLTRWQHVVEAYNQLVRAKFSAIGFGRSW